MPSSLGHYTWISYRKWPIMRPLLLQTIASNMVEIAVNCIDNYIAHYSNSCGWCHVFQRRESILQQRVPQQRDAQWWWHGEVLRGVITHNVVQDSKLQLSLQDLQTVQIGILQFLLVVMDSDPIVSEMIRKIKHHRSCASVDVSDDFCFQGRMQVSFQRWFCSD